MERTNVFFEANDLNRLKEIAADNEQSLAWVIRKVVSGFVKFVDEKQLPTSTVAEVNAAVTEVDQAWADFLGELK
ncbi:hypothetical protein [Andreprevotia chitinilytica]|uniref:hypothetical protein n=1 Tax=Andreprevotia chitinilytica TaxID=396808 RepID=UPI0005590F51|nr:hypothetical protein [Andreprevotia chitinilytica]